METIRKWLTQEGFDWNAGKIIIQLVDEEENSCNSEEIQSAYLASNDDPILSREFRCDFGRSRCPRFIAEDANKIYFPAQYDGSTWIESIHKNVSKYLSLDIPTPYVGV